MYRWWCEGAGDRAWRVIESVFLRSPNKGFWTCLGVLPPPPGMPRRLETWVLLCNLMLKFRGISRSSAILRTDSPQRNNRMDNSLWVTPFIPCERRWHLMSITLLPVIWGYHSLHQRQHWCESCISTAVERRNQGTPLAIRPKIMTRYKGAAASLGWLL